jgi:oxygen-independent coproporphyrinogen-3 oxidase
VSASSDVRAAWATHVWADATVLAITPRAFAYPVLTDNQLDVSTLYHNQQINFFTYVLTRDFRHSGTGGMKTYEYRMEVTYHLQGEGQQSSTFNTVTDRLEAVLALGVNRVSLGGQSFNDGVLAGLGRRHSAQQLREACGWLRTAGAHGALGSWSLDLIVNLPGQSAAAWQQDLEAALAEAPPHLSIYDLIVEPGTVFERRQRQGTLALPEEGAAAERLTFTHQQLAAAGYGHYEISSWALPGHGSRHNRVYWSGASWWACGLGSTAGVDGQRLARPRTREAYGTWLQQRAGDQREGQADGGALPPLDELLLVGLRRREGVNLAWLEATGAWPRPQPLAEALAAPLAPWLERGLVQLEGQQLRLVPPEGFSLSNAVLRDLLVWWEQQGAGQDRPAPPAPSPAGLR